MIEKRKLLELFKKNPNLAGYLEIGEDELANLAFGNQNTTSKVKAFLMLLSSSCNVDWKQNKVIQQVNIVIESNVSEENAN